MTTAWKEFAGAVVLLAIAGAYYAASRSIADSTLSDEVGATGLPRLLALILALLSLALMTRAAVVAMTGRAEDAASFDEPESASLLRVAVLLLLGVGYVLALPYLGYVTSVALLIAAVAIYEGARIDWKTPLIALSGAALYWAVFVKLLNVRQPSGLWPSFVFS